MRRKSEGLRIASSLQLLPQIIFLKVYGCRGIKDSECETVVKTILGGLLRAFVILNFGCVSNDMEKYIEDLESKNVAVGNNAIYYLGKNEEKLAVPMLIEFMNDDQPQRVS